MPPRVPNADRRGAQGNQAAYGGGVFLQDTRAQVVNTLLAGNDASASGGGLYAANSSVRMVNITAAANRAGGSGGGLLLRTAEQASSTR